MAASLGRAAAGNGGPSAAGLLRAGAETAVGESGAPGRAVLGAGTPAGRWPAPPPAL